MMGGMGGPPLPPEVARQAPPRRPFDASEESPSEMGQPQQQDPKMGMLAMLGKNIQALEQGVEETAKMVGQIHPPMQSFLMPIKQGIEAMKKEFVELFKRSSSAGGGSPAIGATPPPNPGQGPELGQIPAGV